jgi:integrase
VRRVAEGKVGFQNQDSHALGEKQDADGKSAELSQSRLHQLPKQPKLKCPQCASERIYKDGMRYLSSGESIQRSLCRDCYHRFSEKGKQNKPPQETSEWQLNTDPALLLNRQERSESRKRQANTLQTGGLTLVTSETQQETAQREGTITSQLTSQLLDYAWQAKKRNLAEQTIRQRLYKLKLLVKRGADLNNPDSILTVLANSTWTQANKRTIVIAYQSFAKTYNLQWQPPKTRVERKIPYIPTEQEISQLIAGCGKKTATLLQTLKDTAARTAEAVKLKWTDIDENKCTIRINNPVKGSLARIVKVTPNTIAMLNNLPRKDDYIFNPNPDTVRKNFCKQRTKIAITLQNPKLKQIHLHTFRHWKATMEYHRTKNIKYVQQMLGHKKIENTDLYTQLLNFENDEWHVAHARTLEEEGKLIEAGFEYVRYSEKDEVAIYRKRK